MKPLDQRRIQAAFLANQTTRVVLEHLADRQRLTNRVVPVVLWRRLEAQGQTMDRAQFDSLWTSLASADAGKLVKGKKDKQFIFSHGAREVILLALQGQEVSTPKASPKVVSEKIVVFEVRDTPQRLTLPGDVTPTEVNSMVRLIKHALE